MQSTWYKRSPYTIRTLSRAPSLQKALMKHLQQQIQKECKQICSRKYGDSVLRLPPAKLKDFLHSSKLKGFQWREISHELKKKAPTLYGILRAACTKDGEEPNLLLLGMAASVLLKARNKFLCLPQAVVSVLLYAGHCSKMVRAMHCY